MKIKGRKDLPVKSMEVILLAGRQNPGSLVEPTNPEPYPVAVCSPEQMETLVGHWNALPKGDAHRCHFAEYAIRIHGEDGVDFVATISRACNTIKIVGSAVELKSIHFDSSSAPSLALHTLFQSLFVGVERRIKMVDSIRYSFQKKMPPNLIIAATGTTAGKNWTDAKLVLREENPAEGAYKFDFVATPPKAYDETESGEIKAAYSFIPSPPGLKSVEIWAVLNFETEYFGQE